MACTEAPSSRASPWPLWSRLKARLGGDLLLQRLAGMALLIRVAAAMLAYGSQVLFARWMDVQHHVWTWVLLIGQLTRPRHRGAALHSAISRTQNVCAVARLCGGQPLARRRHRNWGSGAAPSGRRGGGSTITPSVACVSLSAYALNVQDAISRSHDWVALGIMPTYIFRQILLTTPMGGASSPGVVPIDASDCDDAVN